MPAQEPIYEAYRSGLALKPHPVAGPRLKYRKQYEAVEQTISLYCSISKRAGMASVRRNDDRVARAEEYREIPKAVRDLARQSRFREIKKELYDWAYRCDRIANNLKSQSSRSGERHP
jgi:hypothetical protein